LKWHNDAKPSMVVAMSNKAPRNELLQPFGSSLWIVEGPAVDFYGFPYPTRMVVIALAVSKGAWIWSPILLSTQLEEEILEKAGPVLHVVAPNKLHWLFLHDWAKRYPHARIFAAPGLKERKVVSDIMIDTVLGDIPDPSYASDINQVVFKGSVMDEVVFYHLASKTVIFCDLIQRFPEGRGWKVWLMKVDGLVGEKGSTPREWRLNFWWNGRLDLARAALDQVLWEWKPERLVIAHGACASENATQIVQDCLNWIPGSPRRRELCDCCCKGEAKED
jgi:hypothetical protein